MTERFDVVDSRAPSRQERAKLERVAATPSRVLGAMGAGMLGILLIKALPDEYGAVKAVFIATMLLVVLGALVYQACLQRCPRCSGWIVMPKCPGCGLGLERRP